MAHTVDTRTTVTRRGDGEEEILADVTETRTGTPPLKEFEEEILPGVAAQVLEKLRASG